MFPVAAGAANGGAGAPDVPVSNGGGTPSGGSVLCTVTVPAAGGTVTCSGVTVTEGPTTKGLSIVLSTSTGPVCSVGPALSASFVDPTTGLAVSGPLSTPVTVTLANGNIASGQTVLVYDSSSGEWVLAPSGAVSSGSASGGSVSGVLTGNGAFVATTSNCSAAIPGATLAVTGKPFFVEELMAGGLIVGGALTLGIVLRRRPTRKTAA
jgi:hypothetical protein